MWNLASAPAWSDIIRVTLWRNNVFLHSFRNFSKSNVFSKHLIRTKFILYKIFFRVSILSSNKTSWMFFNLRLKNWEKLFVGGHDHFEGKGRLATKININLFCGKWGFGYFSVNNFFEKNNIFQNNNEK